MTIGVLTSCMFAKFNVICVFNDPHPDAFRSQESHKSYRPVTIATFRLNRLISTSYLVQYLLIPRLTKVYILPQALRLLDTTLSILCCMCL